MELEFIIAQFYLRSIGPKQNLHLYTSAVEHCLCNTTNSSEDFTTFISEDDTLEENFCWGGGEAVSQTVLSETRQGTSLLLQLGLSVRKIAKVLGYSNHIGLNTYIKKRNFRTPQL